MKAPGIMHPSDQPTPSETTALPVWPADIPADLCRISDKGETVILSGRMIPAIKRLQLDKANTENPLIRHVLNPAEPRWDTIRVKQEHAPEIIDALARIARAGLSAMEQIVENANAFSILSSIMAKAMAINYLSGAVRAQGSSEPLDPSPLAFVQISGSYLSIALANTGECRLAEIVLRRHAIHGGSGDLSWSMNDVHPIEDMGGTEIIFDLNAISASAQTLSHLTSILYATIDVLIAYRINPDLVDAFSSNTLTPELLPLRVTAPEITIGKASDRKAVISKLPISIAALDVTAHCLILQTLANQNIPCTVNPVWGSEDRAVFRRPPYTASITILASDLPAALNAIKPAITRFMQFNGSAFLLRDSGIPEISWRRLATIDYDTAHSFLSISGLLIACERAEIIRIADHHRISRSLTLAPSGDGFRIDLDEILHDSILEEFFKDVSSFLCREVNTFWNSDCLYRTPMTLLDMKDAGIVRVSHSAEHKSILIMQITDPEISRIAKRDLIGIGWGWRAVKDAQGLRHENEVKLFLPEETAIEYLLNMACPRTEILLQQTHNIICDKMKQTGNHAVPPSLPKAYSITETDAEDEFSVQASTRTSGHKKPIKASERFRRVLMSTHLLIAVIATLNFILIVNLITDPALTADAVWAIWALISCGGLTWMCWIHTKRKSRE